MQWAMAYMVIFRRPDGKPGYHQADGVDDAVRFVEMLRNQEKVTDARIFRMEEVPIEFRTYYRVEMSAAAPPPAPSFTPAPASTPAPSPAPASPPATDPANGDAAELAPQAVLDPTPVEAVAGRGRRFSRG